MKRLLPRLAFGVACIVWLLGHLVGAWHLPVVTLLDNYSYDARLRAFMENTQDERVVIVDIDEKSLAELGRWPWNRGVLAKLVHQLVDEYEVSAIGFDIVFAETDESSGLPVLEALAQNELRDNPSYQRALAAQRPHLDYDQRFVEALSGRPTVLGFHFSERSGGALGSALPEAQPFSAILAPGQFPVLPGFSANLERFQNAAAGGGHFNPLTDGDGVIRRVPMLVGYQGGYYPALSLAMLQLLVGEGFLLPYAAATDAPLEWIDVVGHHGSLRIPIDGDGAALVPYRGPEGSFPYVSAADVLAGRLDKDQLAERIVLLGTTASGLKDQRSTPVGAAYPGVEVHANLISGALDGSIREKPHYMIAVEVFLLVAIGGSLAIALPFLSPLAGTALTLLMLAALTVGAVALWQAGLVISFAAVILASVAIYGFNAAWGFFWESQVKRQFTALFGQYVPPELVDEMARNPAGYSMEGRNAVMTVMFSDVRDFTTLSEGLTAKELSSLMNEYLGAMTLIIQQQRGTLDKYIGDAIMAFWGAPIAEPEHARKAVIVALEMQQAMQQLNERFQARGWPKLRIGIGINTGMMTVGDMGSQVRKAYTVIGDAVNLSARLEGLTKFYGVDVAVGEETQAACPDIVFRELDKARVKGKTDAVAIFEPIGQVDTVTSEKLAEIDQWHEALEHYRRQQWDEASTILEALRAAFPAVTLYVRYIERIARLREDPSIGPEWDGVMTFNRK